jgi:hypothetical protein
MVSCNAMTHAGEVLLAWSPATPDSGRQFTATADQHQAATYTVAGQEISMKGGTSGPGTIPLAEITDLPKQTLTIRGVLGDDTIVFPFGDLPATARKSLSACF